MTVQIHWWMHLACSLNYCTFHRRYDYYQNNYHSIFQIKFCLKGLILIVYNETRSYYFYKWNINVLDSLNFSPPLTLWSSIFKRKQIKWHIFFIYIQCPFIKESTWYHNVFFGVRVTSCLNICTYKHEKTFSL